MDIVHKSFIREILKVTENPNIISFAGGLPDPDLFPVRELAKAAKKVFGEDGKNALQYSTTEGYLPLRKYISIRYSKKYGKPWISGSYTGIYYVRSKVQIRSIA